MKSLCYIDPKTREGAAWLRSHEKLRDKPRSDMPRARLERELAEWMLADKEAHTGVEFGANPRTVITINGASHELPFRESLEFRAPIVNDAGRMKPRTEAQERASAFRIASDAERCAEMFRAVLLQLSLDRYAGDGGAAWGTPKDDRRFARMFFEARSPHWDARREYLCGLAMVEAEAFLRADAEGRLRNLGADAIGKRRYETRLANAEATAKQPDLFRSMGLTR